MKASEDKGTGQTSHLKYDEIKYLGQMTCHYILSSPKKKKRTDSPFQYIFKLVFHLTSL